MAEQAVGGESLELTAFESGLKRIDEIGSKLLQEDKRIFITENK